MEASKNCTTLNGTPLEFVYHLISSSSDQELLNKISTILGLSIVGLIISHISHPLPYGKGKEISTETWKLLEICPLPSRFVWKWGFIPTTIVPWIVIFLTPAPNLFHPMNATALIIYYGHYSYRAFIYSARISEKAHSAGIVIFVGVFLVNVIHTFYHVHNIVNVLPPEGFSARVILGGALAGIGTGINQYHDSILLGLRSKGKKNSGYQIPTGGLFQYISCANYFGEILEWWGLAMVTLSMPEVMFAIFSTVTLGLKASDAQQFYFKRFGDKYPRGRWAILPFIY